MTARALSGRSLICDRRREQAFVRPDRAVRAWALLRSACLAMDMPVPGRRFPPAASIPACLAMSWGADTGTSGTPSLRDRRVFEIRQARFPRVQLVRLLSRRAFNKAPPRSRAPVALRPERPASAVAPCDLAFSRRPSRRAHRRVHSRSPRRFYMPRRAAIPMHRAVSMHRAAVSNRRPASTSPYKEGETIPYLI